MAERSFAGFTYSQRLTVGFYGEVYRGRTASDTEVEVLHLDPHLTSQPGFTEALTRHGTELGLLQHRNAVSTLTMGKASDGNVVVVTEPVPSGSTVEEILQNARNAGTRLPAHVALGIGRAAVAGLACAHNVNIVHGGIHPRSVLVDRSGIARVTDFAAARALAIAAAGSDDAELYKGFGGYLAPELALGDPPSTAVDVYAMGALLFTLLTGDAPPGELGASPSVAAVVNRALATDLARRFGDARALERELEQALTTDGCDVATVAEIAEFLGNARASTEQRLDDGVDDLLSILGDEPEAAPRAASPKSLRASRVGDLPGLPTVGDEDEPTNVAGEEVTDVASAQVGHDDEETLVAPDKTGSAALREDTALTHVDDSPLDARDPISELIELEQEHAPTKPHALPTDSDFDDGHTPLPPPTADAPGTYTRAGEEILRRGSTRSVEEKALGAIASLEEDDDEGEGEGHDTIRRDKPKTSGAKRSPENAGKATGKATVVAKPIRARAVAVEPEAVEPELSLGKSRTGMWMGITVLSLIGMFLFLYFKTDLFHPERERAREAARKRKQAQIDEDSKPPPVGIVALRIEPRNSAVWMSLGASPAQTPLLVPSSTVWQLRFEKEGFLPADVNVVATHWSGAGKGRKADVTATLRQGTAKKVRAAPRPPKPAEQSGLTDGQGRIHATSTPPGATVWLFLGVGDLERLAVEAGKGYTFKIHKDGYAPATVEIPASAWKGTDGEQISKSVTLEKSRR